jgi:hypothetical protein
MMKKKKSLKNLRTWPVVLAIGASGGGCAVGPGVGTSVDDVDSAGTLYVPTTIAAQVQAVIDDSGASPMVASADSPSDALAKFRSQNYQHVLFSAGDISLLPGESKVTLGTREVRVARSTAQSMTPAQLSALWFGSPTGAFLARNADPETRDVLGIALGATIAESSDVVQIAQGIGSISATRGGAPFAITASDKCPTQTTVDACLTHLAGVSGWTVLAPYSGTGGVALSLGMTLAHPIEFLTRSGKVTAEATLDTWIAAHGSGVDTDFSSPTYKP